MASSWVGRPAAAAARAAADGALGPGKVLTPHAGELAEMLGVERTEVEAAPTFEAGSWPPA